VTHRFTRTAIFAVIAALALALAPGALAAVEQGDAGDLPATANDFGDGAVTTIWGSFTDAADADMYRVCLTDGASFSASTVGATTLDTQMFLLDSQGYGVYANDDWNGSRGSMLPANHRFSPDEGGEYYLAVSSYNRDPQSSQGEIFQDMFNRFSYPDGVLDPNGFGAAEPISGWNGRAPGGPGLYRVTLTGTKTCVPPDTTPPTVDLRSPVNGAHVPQNAEVVVDFSCSDEGSSGLASCQGTTADGELLDTSRLGEVSVAVTARDNAGNETTVTSTVTVVDEKKPEVTITTPADGATYERGEQVTADYSCADEPNGSGIESCVGDVANGAAVDTSSLGDHTFAVQATDRAGNTDTKTVTYTVVDVTGPSITLSSPASGAVYARGELVSAAYSCADEGGGSGVASCVGTVANGAPVDTSSLGQKTFTVEATDAAGNATSKRVTYTVADRSGPSISIAAPVDGATYSLGQKVTADFACADEDGGSGVAACEGTVPDGARIDTSSFGEHTFTVHARDGAGNDATKAVTYTVGYDFDGFGWPVRNLPAVNKWKAGVPVLIRFSLNGYRGSQPEAEGYPRSMRCGGGDVTTIARAKASKNTKASKHKKKSKPTFVYERRSDRYMMLWRTERKWAGSCREFVLKLDDGSVHTARFQFVKRLGRD
jgi:hypothetical protein